MASLTIRNIGDDLKRKLRVQAARNGRSMEEEARRLLAANVTDEAPAPPRPETAGEVIRRLRERAGGGADFEPLDRSEWTDRPVDFG